MVEHPQLEGIADQGANQTGEVRRSSYPAKANTVGPNGEVRRFNFHDGFI